MIKIREIQEKDYQKTSEMIKLTIRDSLKNLYPKKLIDELCKKYNLENFREKAKTIQFFVAKDESDSRIVGIIGIKDNQLRTFYVNPKHQGKGIGQLLYNKFEAVAKERGLKKVTLEGSPLGEPIYKHFGFKKIKTIFKERKGMKYTDAFMEKLLWIIWKLMMSS